MNILDIVNEYDNNDISIQKLSQLYNIPRGTLIYNIKKYSQMKPYQRHYGINDLYFQNGNINNQHYIMGLIWADGCIKYNNNIRIELQSQDIDILYKIQEEFQITYNIIKQTSRIRNNLVYNYVRISIKSKIIYDDLSYLLHNKNDVPFYNYNCFSHFLRGLSDGDGTVYIAANKNISSWSIVVHDLLVDIIVKNIKELLNIHVSVSNHWRTSYIKILSINGNKQVYKFLNWLYKDAQIYLNRKYNKYIQIKERFESQPHYNLIRPNCKYCQNTKVKIKDSQRQTFKCLNCGRTFPYPFQFKECT